MWIPLSYSYGHRRKGAFTEGKEKKGDRERACTRGGRPPSERNVGKSQESGDKNISGIGKSFRDLSCETMVKTHGK